MLLQKYPDRFIQICVSSRHPERFDAALCFGEAKLSFERGVAYAVQKRHQITILVLIF